MEEVLRKWDIGKLEIKPGDILVFRLHRERYPGLGGIDYPLSYELTQGLLEAGKKTVRECLDKIGLTEDKVPILFITEDWDIHAICPLELLYKSNLAAQAKEAADESSGASH